jgi:hypothetical protein
MKLPILNELQFWYECWKALHCEDIAGTLTDDEYFNTGDYIREQISKVEEEYTLLILRHLYYLKNSSR